MRSRCSPASRRGIADRTYPDGGLWLRGRGGGVWWLGTPFGLAKTKDIGEERIMIGRNYRFFVDADLVSSPRNEWNRGGVLSSAKKGFDAQLNSMISLTPSIGR